MKYALVNYSAVEKIVLPDNITSIGEIRYAKAMMAFRYPNAELQSIEIKNDEDADRTGSNGVGTTESPQAA